MTYIQDYLPPGRDQLMKPPRPHLNGKTKEIRYNNTESVLSVIWNDRASDST
jgi:hypothetical protein